jgi:hypothetical protein
MIYWQPESSIHSAAILDSLARARQWSALSKVHWAPLLPVRHRTFRMILVVRKLVLLLRHPPYRRLKGHGGRREATSALRCTCLGPEGHHPRRNEFSTLPRQCSVSTDKHGAEAHVRYMGISRAMGKRLIDHRCATHRGIRSHHRRRVTTAAHSVVIFIGCPNALESERDGWAVQFALA